MTIYKEFIPTFVWDFAKKHTTSTITAGILAMVIWNFMKKHKNEGYINTLHTLCEKYAENYTITVFNHAFLGDDTLTFPTDNIQHIIKQARLLAKDAKDIEIKDVSSSSTIISKKDLSKDDDELAMRL